MPKLICCPGCRTNDTGIAGIANPGPEILICEIVTLSEPVLVRVMGKVLPKSKTTLPKFVLAGDTVNRRVNPVPDSDTVDGEFEAVLPIETVPVTLPVAAGTNDAVKAAL